jgi:urease accessory protein
MTRDAGAGLLLLADGRFPSGGYAHSGGVEAAIRAGRVRDVADLSGFLRGRMHTAGVVGAAFAAATCHAFAAGDDDRLAELDAELDARIPSPALRSASHALGRQLRRAVERIRPGSRLDQLGSAPHHPMVFGAAAHLLGAGPYDAALGVVYEAVTGAATAMVRLLAVDPFEVHALLAALTPDLDELARRAARDAVAPPAELPAGAAPLLDIGAEHHAITTPRLFAS